MHTHLAARTSLALITLAFFHHVPLTTNAAEPEVIKLWPSTVPGETKELPPEGEMTRDGKKMVAGQPIFLLTNVSKPELAIYRPEAANNTGAAVIICPGGGHSVLAYDLEGTEIAQWLNTIGITGIVLKYRVPFRDPNFKCFAALQDVQRAVSLVRARCKEFGVDAAKIGVLGFSAGGEVAARASLQFNDRKYEKQDPSDETSCRPDFALLIYTAYLVQDNQELFPELKPTKDAPPMFLVHTWDDPVTPLSSLCLSTELKRVGVSCELHMFAHGGHGYGMRHIDGVPVTDWTSQATPWLGKMIGK
jgi:acetyl esterase/lipase